MVIASLPLRPVETSTCGTYVATDKILYFYTVKNIRYKELQ